MKLTLATFQQNALSELRSNCDTAQQLCKKNQCILSLSAPTGAGKTIIMANLIEDILCGSAERGARCCSVAVKKNVYISVSFCRDSKEKIVSLQVK